MSKNVRQKRLDARRKKQTRQRLIVWSVLGFAAVLAVFFGLNRTAPEANPALSENELAGLPVAPEVGSRAPDFTLSSAAGQEVSLSDFRGKPVAMMFFHTW